jgi:hypothetical protein
MKVLYGKDVVVVSTNLSFKKVLRDFLLRNVIVKFHCFQCFVLGRFYYPHVSRLQDKNLSCKECLKLHFEKQRAKNKIKSILKRGQEND